MKPSLIKVPAVRVTARFDEETRQILRDSIKEVGIIAPVIVQDIEGELVLVDGLHRLEDSIVKGDSTIDVVVLDGDMADLLCRNLFLDHARGKTPVSDMVKVINALYVEYNLDPDKIKAKTGLTRDYIEKLIKISQASPVVQLALDEGIIGVGHAFELSRLPYAIQQEELIAKHQIYRFKVSDLHEFVDNVLKEMGALKEAAPAAGQPATRPPAVYHCEGCKEEVEPRYLRPVMVCPDCFGEIWKLAKVKKAAEVKVEDEGATP